MNLKNKIIISIEGNIGVGKSSFITLLKQRLNQTNFNSEQFEFVYEPVDEWLDIKDKEGVNLLDTFYKDTKRWAYTFQNIAYITRMNRLIDALNKDKVKVIILDRSLSCDLNTFTKMLYDSGDMSEIEYVAYQKWNTFYDKYFGKNIKHYVVYLRSKPDTAYNRIHLRKREEENKIPLSYLERLHKYHDEWLIYRDDTVIIDADKEFVYDEKNFEDNFIKFERILNSNV